MSTDLEVVQQQIQRFKEEIAKSQQERDDDKPFVRASHHLVGPSPMGLSTQSKHWDEWIKMLVKGLADAEARLTILANDEI